MGTGVPATSNAATVIARRGVRGRRDGARAEVVEVVAGRDHRNDSGRGSRVERERDHVAARLDLRLADREVEDVHAVSHGGLDRGDELGRVPVRAQARVRADERLVVPEVGARCDTGDPPAARAVRPRVPGRDAGDVRAVARVLAVDRERPPAGSCAPGGANARATITFAFVNRVCPFGKPAGIV